MLTASERWKTAYPGASVGLLAMVAHANSQNSPELASRKEALEADLRARFASLNRGELRSLPQLAPYTAYYRHFDKTYHVQHQLESVVFKGKGIPRGSPLVDAMFMAELKNLLLTAGHDLDSVRGGIVVDVATGAETYLTLSEHQQTLKQGDMFIRDQDGVLSSILHGPDHRTRIVPSTTRVLFTVYAPAGVPAESVRAHLRDIAEFVSIVSPAAKEVHAEVVEAGEDR